MNNAKIFLVSLGCPKNLVDSENLLALLGEKSYALTVSPDEADVLIVNTCGFLQSAVEESAEVIENLCRKKKKGQKIIVYGCLVQRYGKKLPGIKGVDALFGVGNPEKIVSVISKISGKHCKSVREASPDADNSEVRLARRSFGKGGRPLPQQKDSCLPRLISTYPYAYIKISEGCENFCSYCLIPSIRGHIKSRGISDIYREAESIKDMGIKELTLIAQDTGNYGKDLKGKTTIERLLKKLAGLDFHWIRVMYMHPAHINNRILKTIVDEPKICRYLDIPLQHIHPEILKKMNRPVLDYGGIIDRIRTVIPEIRLRTTLITGFPGEKERHFRKLLEFIEEKEFDRLGVFPYSREKGTPAYSLPGQVPEKVKRERERILMELQRKISRRKLKKLAGTEMEVLVEGRQGNRFTGRTEFDAPDIDGTVYIKTKKKLQAGDFCKVRITSSGDHDLSAIL